MGEGGKRVGKHIPRRLSFWTGSYIGGLSGAFIREVWSRYGSTGFPPTMHFTSLMTNVPYTWNISS